MPTYSVLRSAIRQALLMLTAETQRRREEWQFSPRFLCVSASLRFNHLFVTQESVYRMRGQLAVLHRLYRQFLSTAHAIAAREHARHRRLPIGVHCDAAVLDLQRLLAAIREGIRDKRLPDRLEHRVGREREALARADQLAALQSRILELGPVHPSAFAEQPRRLRPVLDLHAVGLRELLLVRRGAHLLGPAAIDDG